MRNNHKYFELFLTFRVLFLIVCRITMETRRSACREKSVHQHEPTGTKPRGGTEAWPTSKILKLFYCSTLAVSIVLNDGCSSKHLNICHRDVESIETIFEGTTRFFLASRAPLLQEVLIQNFPAKVQTIARIIQRSDRI